MQSTVELTPPKDIVIVSEGEKGTAFKAQLLAYACADNLWPGGDTETVVRRPVWIAFGCSEDEASAFSMNLKMGHKAEIEDSSGRYRSKNDHGERFELLRGGRGGWKYEYRIEKHPTGWIVKAFLSTLLQHDPGMVESGDVVFVLLPDVVTVEALAYDVDRAMRHLERAGDFSADFASLDEDVVRRIAPIAPLFALYIDRRTHAPMIPDTALYLQILVAAINQGFASLGRKPETASKYKRSKDKPDYREYQVADVNMVPGVAFKAKHEQLGAFIAEQISIYTLASAGDRDQIVTGAATAKKAERKQRKKEADVD